MAGNFCSITDALAEAQFEILKRINNKFAALRRLGQLLEQLGDLSNLIPNIANLIPVIDIGLDTYANLRASCPFLNLPAPGDASLEKLRNEVITAYSTLTRGILNHPWMRMGKLQDELSKAQDKVNSAFAQGGQFIQCLQAACRTVQSATAFVQRVGQTNISAEIGKTFNNFVTQGGNVLSAAGQAKLNDARAVVNQMQALGADVKSDYAAAQAGLPNITPPAATPSSIDTGPSNPVVTLPTFSPSTPSAPTAPTPVTTLSTAPEVMSVVAPTGSTIPHQVPAGSLTDDQIFAELQRIQQLHRP